MNPSRVSGPSTGVRPVPGVAGRCAAARLLRHVLAVLFLTTTAAPGMITNLAELPATPPGVVRTNPIPISVEGTVTYRTFFNPLVVIQNGTNAVDILAGNNNAAREMQQLRPGQRVLVTGAVVDRMPRGYISVSNLTLRPTVPMPGLLQPPVDQLADGSHHLRRVRVQGVVRDMVLVNSVLWLNLTHQGWVFPVTLPVPRDFPLPRHWLESDLRVDGTVVASADNSGRYNGFSIWALQTNDVRLLAAGDPRHFDQPALTVEAAMERPLSHLPRIKLAGTVLLHQASGSVFLEDSTGTAEVELLPPLPRFPNSRFLEGEPQTPLSPGEMIEILARPSGNEGRLLRLRYGTYRRRTNDFAAPPRPPVPFDFGQLPPAAVEGRLVTVPGRLLAHQYTTIPNVHTHRFVISGGDHVFEAIWKGTRNPPWELEGLDWVQLTGIIRSEPGRDASRRPFRLLLRTPADLQPAGPAPLWHRPEARRNFALSGSIVLVAVLALLWQWRHVRHIRRSEQRFRALIDHSFDATVVLDSSGRFKFLSPAGQRLLRGPGAADAPLPPTLADAIQTDDRAALREATGELGRQPGESRPLAPFRLVRKDGSVRHAEAVATNCLAVPGVEGIVVNIRDITERHAADEAARRSETVTRSINQLATSLLERDTEDEIVNDLIRNCTTQFGFADCEIGLREPRRGVLVVQSTRQPAGSSPGRERLVRLGEGVMGRAAFTGRVEHIDDAGADAELSTSAGGDRRSLLAVPIVANGEILGVIASGHPLPRFFTTEHRQALTAVASLCASKLLRARALRELHLLNASLEQRVADRTTELRQINSRLEAEVGARQRAEADLRLALATEQELGQLRSSFVSMVSHQFRTPLGAILSSAELLELYHDKLSPEKRFRHLQTIHESVVRMSGLVDEVLLFQRSEARNLEFRPGPFDLPALARALVEEVRSASSNRCPVTCEIGDLPPAYGDPGLLRHVLTNLLDNAVKYSPAGRPVSLRIRAAECDAVFTIQDTGAGIPIADQASLFEPFHRGSNTRGLPGTGLGLVIVKRCVERHGGQLSFVSVEGDGTTFTVRVPLFPANPDPGTPPAPAGRSTAVPA